MTALLAVGDDFCKDVQGILSRVLLCRNVKNQAFFSGVGLTNCLESTDLHIDGAEFLLLLHNVLQGKKAVTIKAFYTLPVS